MRPLQLQDLSDSYKLYLYLVEKEKEVEQLKKELVEVRRVAVEPIDLNELRDSFELGGSHELDLTGLGGTGADDQNPSIPRVSALPDVSSTLYTAVVLTGGVADQLYVLDKTGTPYVWRQIATTPTNMVTTDTVQNITGVKTFKSQTIFDEPTGAILIKPDSAPVANTKLLDVQSSLAASLASIDAEGDAIFGASVRAAGANAIFDARANNNGSPAFRMQNAAGTSHWQISETTGAAGQQGNLLLVFDNVAGATRITVNVTTGLVTIAQGLTVTGAFNGSTGVFSSTLQAAATTLASLVCSGAATVGTTLGVTGTSTLAAATLSGLLTANLGITTTGAAAKLNHELHLGGRVADSSATYTVAAGIVFVEYGRSSTGTGTVNLPAAPSTGQLIVIKDTGFNAAVNNIVVSGNGKNIDGAASYNEVVSGFCVAVWYNGTEWFRIAHYP